MAQHSPPPVQIAEPCPMRWAEMKGDERRRFCEQCQLHVHNLSVLTSREQQRFAANMEGRTCVAYELRADGSMISRDQWRWLTSPLRKLGWRALTIIAACVPMLSACATRKSGSRSEPTCVAPPELASDGKEEQVIGVSSPSRHDKWRYINR